MQLRHSLFQNFGVNILLKLFALSLASIGSSAEQSSGKSSVAIVGAGIGGSTAAYFLRQELGDSIDIHL